MFSPIVVILSIALIGTKKPISANFETSSNDTARVSVAYPEGTGDIYIKDCYALAYEEKHEQASWVQYLLTRKGLKQSPVKRSNDFREDTYITTGSSEKGDYYRSGYDRGHLCPAADRSYSTLAMSHTFLMSNMSPQLPRFNRGIWKKLESEIRKYALKEDSIIVVTGPVLTITPLGTIGANNVTVPGAYYKAIYDLTPPHKTIAYILPHKEDLSKDLSQYCVSVDILENLTGIDFFPGIREEKELESRNSYSAWSN